MPHLPYPRGVPLARPASRAVYNAPMVRQKLQSFVFAWQGIRAAWRGEFNFRLEVVAALFATMLSLYLEVTAVEFLLVAISISLVLVAELFNTALEELCDKFSAEHDPHIGRIKDFSAAAVSLASCGALVVGLIVFLPRLVALV